MQTVHISKISIYIPSNRTQPIFLVSGVIDATYELAVNKTRIGTPYLDEINIAEAAVQCITNDKPWTVVSGTRCRFSVGLMLSISFTDNLLIYHQARD